jgi:hypothetical protein
MNAVQTANLIKLGSRLGVAHGSLRIIGEKDGYVFVDRKGITVLLTSRKRNPDGGFKVPSLRTYLEIRTPTNLEAAIRADELFAAQNADAQCGSGHFGPLVGVDWKCDDAACPCFGQSEPERKLRSL